MLTPGVYTLDVASIDARGLAVKDDTSEVTIIFLQGSEEVMRTSSVVELQGGSRMTWPEPCSATVDFTATLPIVNFTIYADQLREEDVIGRGRLVLKGTQLDAPANMQMTLEDVPKGATHVTMQVSVSVFGGDDSEPSRASFTPPKLELPESSSPMRSGPRKGGMGGTKGGMGATPRKDAAKGASQRSTPTPRNVSVTPRKESVTCTSSPKPASPSSTPRRGSCAEAHTMHPPMCMH